jgi:hypothetical protein
MAHDVFISYSSKDKPIADGICANLESTGLRCWIAPRDIAPGQDWPTAIANAISSSKVMVLVFSASSNSSEDVGREIVLAANHKLIIIPFKIDNIEPEPGKQYYLARTHWLEAMNPPTREQVRILVERIRSVVTPVSLKDTNQPEATAVLPSVPSISSKRDHFQWSYLGLVAALLVFILVIIFWPKLQGEISSPTATSTPTATVTNTLLPSPTVTVLPTATPTRKPIASSTPRPTTGTVTGQVKWGDQPFEGVIITLCSYWTGTCKGQEYATTSDAQGNFTVQDVMPARYTVIHSVPEQYGLIPPADVKIEVQVSAGSLSTLTTIINQCKYDLQVFAPVVQNGQVTLRWSATPGGEYNWYIGDVYWSSGGEGFHVRSTTAQRNLPSGSYLWYVEADGYSGGGASCGIGRFTIP